MEKGPHRSALSPEVPPDETILFLKINLLDGFWRMIVSEADSYNFVYVLPA
jgi:hypothetical protein